MPHIYRYSIIRGPWDTTTIHPSPSTFPKKKRTPQNPIDKCPKNFTPGNQSSRRNNHIRHKQNRFPITFARSISRRRVGKLLLVRDHQPRNACRGKSRYHTRDHGRYRQARDVAGPSRRDLREHANLGPKRTEVAEAAERICSDEARAVREGLELRLGLEASVRHEFIR